VPPTTIKPRRQNKTAGGFNGNTAATGENIDEQAADSFDTLIVNKPAPQPELAASRLSKCFAAQTGKPGKSAVTKRKVLLGKSTDSFQLITRSLVARRDHR
jgi:hypothetical protein